MAVLSVRGMSKGALLEGTAWEGRRQQEGAGGGGDAEPLPPRLALGQEEVALLEACGYSPSAGLRSLVNFSGADRPICFEGEAGLLA